MQSVYDGPVRLVLFDVDGVLTNGKLHISKDGEETKTFNVKDGVAVALLQSHGILCGIMSGKASAALDYRVKQLGFDMALTGCSNKLSTYFNLREKLKLSDHQVAFVGDDIIDLSVMQQVGLAIAPADAHQLVIKNAQFITLTRGGQGVAREAAEYILQSAGLDIEEMYQPLLENWEASNVRQ
ncbi:MAG: 3-deoxy-D-manno-octulosonate 8-phosphate phosphatase [Sphingopyxis sp.]|nr:MAG: 3-deoxy-D-manno-octulosonate 8-phosphate phosphatase [Sphingopyxis sp.]